MTESPDHTHNRPNDEIDLAGIIRKIYVGRKTMVIVILICMACGCAWYGYRMLFVKAKYESSVIGMIESSVISRDDLMVKVKKGETEEVAIEFTVDSVNPELLPLIVSSSPFLNRMGNIRIPEPGKGTLIPILRYMGIESAGAPVRQSVLAEMISAKAGPGKTITLKVVMPDPAIAAIVADSVVACLTPFVLEYSTRKASENLNFIIGLKAEADSAYLATLQAISAFHANKSVPVLQRKEMEEKRLQAAYKIAFDRVSLLSRAVEKAQFRVQAQTPSITVFQPATAATRINTSNLLMILAVSVFAGFLAGIALLYLREIQWNVT